MKLPFAKLLERSAALVLIILFSLSPMTVIPVSGDAGKGGALQVSMVQTRAAGGPMVNRSVITIDDLYEDFAEIEQFLYMTGKGAPQDIFYDPNYDWNKDLWKPKPAPGVEVFRAVYPSGYDSTTTPIRLGFVYDITNVNFGVVTLQKPRSDFNTENYGQDYFVITLVAQNKSGTSEAELRIKVIPVNDAPQQISGRDFFSMTFMEDAYYEGVNKYHDGPNMIFGDLKDPFDTITYTFIPFNEAANHISIEQNTNGSYVKFTPEAEWACQYLPKDYRLKGINLKDVAGYDDYNPYFAHFLLNCSDQNGAYFKPMPSLYVHVAPVNDPPTMDPEGDVRVNEGDLCQLQLSGSDLDMSYQQTVIFGTNITTSIYDGCRAQIEFQSEYFWKRETGQLKFRTDNDMVGTYQVAAWVRDRSTMEMGSPSDYPVTSYPVYSNFTLNIVNINTPPTAKLSEPFSTFDYNTSAAINFNALLSTDLDIKHGDTLNYTWYVNDEVFGYGASFKKMITVEGFYNVTLNVSDSQGLYDLDYVDIVVKKARILGEIFEGKDLTRSYQDNTTSVVLYRTQKEAEVRTGGKYALDLKSVQGERVGAVYKIKVLFESELVFLFTDELRNEPTLNIYFLKPDFKEQPVDPSAQEVASYNFPVPSANYRYSRLEFDLSLPQTTYPLQTVYPNIRILDGKMGVEIVLTIVELDLLGVQPDFVLYAVSEMKTQILNPNGMVLEEYRSWDATGKGAMPPQIETGPSDDDENGEDGSMAWLWILIVVVVIILLVAAVVGIFLLLGRKKEPEYVPPPYVPEQSVDQMVFGELPESQRPAFPLAPQPPGLSKPIGGPEAALPAAEAAPPVQPSMDQMVQNPPAVQAPPPAPTQETAQTLQ